MPGRQGRQAGEATRQARLIRPSCARRGGVPGRQGRQTGEAGQAVMCWGGRVPGRQGRQAGEAAGKARPPGRQGRVLIIISTQL